MIRARSGKTAAGRLLLGVGVLALIIPAVAGCEAGYDSPTQEFHSASSGAQTVYNGIRITNAFVLGAPTGSNLQTGSSASLFVSLYNGGNTADSLLGVSSGWANSITVSGGAVALPPRGAPVNLTGPQPEVTLERLTKPLNGGTSIPVTFEFEHAGQVTLQVPVEPQSFQWSTFSPAPVTPTATPTATPTGTATPAAKKAKAKATGTASPAATS